jgi:hypothetical protein
VIGAEKEFPTKIRGVVTRNLARWKRTQAEDAEFRRAPLAQRPKAP